MHTNGAATTTPEALTMVCAQVALSMRLGGAYLMGAYPMAR